MVSSVTPSRAASAAAGASLAAIFARIAGVVVAFLCSDDIIAQHPLLRALPAPRSDHAAQPPR
jgi:hypothetical protein